MGLQLSEHFSQAELTTTETGHDNPPNATAVGGVPNSAHRLGFACDFVCPSFGSPLEVCRALDAAEKAGRIKFDQLIQEGGWIHISRDPQLRGQRLTLTGPGQYAAGIHPTPA
jgi:hypothetical protein